MEQLNLFDNLNGTKEKQPRQSFPFTQAQYIARAERKIPTTNEELTRAPRELISRDYEPIPINDTGIFYTPYDLFARHLNDDEIKKIANLLITVGKKNIPVFADLLYYRGTAYYEHFDNFECLEDWLTKTDTPSNVNSLELDRLEKRCAPLFEETAYPMPQRTAIDAIAACCAKDNLRPVMCGVYHDNGKLVGCNAQILAAIEQPYDPQLEGKVVLMGKNAKDKNLLSLYNGSNIYSGETDYPKYESVIPDITNKDNYGIKWAEVKLDIADLYAFTARHIKENKIKNINDEHSICPTPCLNKPTTTDISDLCRRV